MCGFNLQLVHLMGRLGSSSLATLSLGFNYGFISTSTCESSTGVQLLRLPWRAWFDPERARYGGGAAPWVTGVLAAPVDSGGLAARAAENIVLWKGYGNQYWPICSSILAWRTPSLTEKPGRPQSTGSQRAGHD